MVPQRIPKLSRTGLMFLGSCYWLKRLRLRNLSITHFPWVDMKMKNWQRSAVLIICLTILNTTGIGYKVIKKEPYHRINRTALEGLQKSRPSFHRSHAKDPGGFLELGWSCSIVSYQHQYLRSPDFCSVLLSIHHRVPLKRFKNLEFCLFKEPMCSFNLKEEVNFFSFLFSLVSTQFKKASEVWLFLWSCTYHSRGFF